MSKYNQPNRKDMKRIIAFCILSFCVLSSFATNRALLIGIGEYNKDTYWNKIHGDSDVELLKPFLEKEGFVVNTLINGEATKEGIINALDTLIKECEMGDIVYFHFSGHGQPMEDINGDELTMFDQTMVPFDAARVCINGYNGENHFVDDEYSYYLNTLRNKLGQSGQLFIAVDACHSQGIERGELTDSIDASLPVRGTSDEFRFKNTRPTQNKPATMLSGGAKTIVVSACGKEERNYEYRSPSGKMYGSLSYCISFLLRSSSDFVQWTTFFEQKKYEGRNFFQTIQHPTIKVYK